MKNKNLFYCYSFNLLQFLLSQGHSFVLNGTNSNTKRDYWVFRRTSAFLKDLTTFTEEKNKNIQ